MIEQQIEAINVDAVMQSLEEIHSFEYKQALHEIGTKFINRIRLGFRKSTDPYGKPWAHLRHRDGQPLLDTGTLLRSIRFEVKNETMTIGSGLHYAQYHQNGTGNIPARKFIPDSRGLPQEWVDQASAILINNIMKNL